MILKDEAFMVRPLEPVYFGGPSSFSAGESHHGYSGFPPNPRTFQGLVRSHLLHSVTAPHLDLDDWSRSAKAERESLVGGPDTIHPGWQLQGPFPARRQLLQTENDEAPQMVIEPWVPVPRFLLKQNGAPLHARPVDSTHPGLNDLNGNGEEHLMLLVGRPEADALTPLEGWIGPDNLYFALAGEGQGTWNPRQNNSPYPPFTHVEFQPGVAIDIDKRTSRTGMLYTLESIRFEDAAGLVGWFNGDLGARISEQSLAQGVAGAGRKRRLAVFEPVDIFHPVWRKLKKGEHLPREVDESQYFWLFLLTAAHIQNPVHPRIRALLPPETTIVIRAALTGAPIVVGGFQMATGCSRANRLYIPAGSSWLFQVKGGDADTRARALQQLHDQHVLGPAQEAEFGFGHTFVGIGPDNQGELQ